MNIILFVIIMNSPEKAFNESYNVFIPKVELRKKLEKKKEKK